MTKVILNRDKNLHPNKFKKGDEADIPDNVAQRWVNRGIAHYGDSSINTLEKFNHSNLSYTSHPKVSIIILVKDALEYFKACIESIKRFTHNYELIIVDNGSNKETKMFLENLDLDFTLIINDENKGVSYGWNQGIKVATCDYICILNSDTIVTGSWLDRLMNGFKYADNIGIVGPTGCATTGLVNSCLVNVNINDSDKFNKLNKVAAKLQEGYQIRQTVAYCWIVKHEVFDRIGVFDHKRFGIASQEDMDFLWRANKTGFKSLWVKHSYVHHFGGQSTLKIDNYDEIVKRNRKIKEERKKDSNLYIKNDVRLDNIRKIKNLKDEKVSIIILVRDALEYFKKCLNSIVKHTINYELIVIDNASNSTTKKYLAEKQKELNFTLVINKENMGFSYGNNQGIKLTTSDYICFLNSDTVVTKGWIEKLINGLNLPRAGIVGPSTNWACSKQMIVRGNNTIIDNIVLPKGYEEANFDLMGFCMAIKREVLNKIGGWDHISFPFIFAEDRDFVRRIKRAGYKAYWIKDCYIHHYGSKTIKEHKINCREIHKVTVPRLAEKEHENIYVENNVELSNIIRDGRKAVITCITGGYDDLKEKHLPQKVKFIAFIDRNVKSDLWEIRKSPNTGNPHMDSRIVKWLIHNYVDCDYSLWIDGNITLNVSMDELIDKYLTDTDIAMCKHPLRDCIYEEAEACKKRYLDYPYIINKRVDKLKREGYPKHNGLHEGTIILRRHTDRIKEFNEAVWNDIQSGSRRDQLSLNYVAWKMGINIKCMPNKWKSPNFKVMRHRKENKRFYGYSQS